MDILLIAFAVIIVGLLAYLVLQQRQNKSDATVDPLGLDRIHELELDKARLEDRHCDALAQVAKLENQLQEVRDHVQQLSIGKATAEAHNQNLEQKLESQKQELEGLQERFKTEFENIASKILKQNSSDFEVQHKKSLDSLLTPFKEKMESFEKQVKDTYLNSTREREGLKKEVQLLHELNQQISAEARSLTNALKGDNKAQGNWGELILTRVLESSGLEAGREYEVQFATENDEGKRIQPDVVVYLPDEKHLIIDSKVSLIAYEQYVNSDSPEEQERLMREHVASVKTHIKGLSEKNYQTGARINSPEFVLLFMPIESSFGLAIRYDKELYAYAWDRKIVIVSPTTLLATLKTIESMWKQEKQTRNVLEIANEAGRLYDKVAGFVDDMEKMGRNLETATKSYESSMNKLSLGRGNILGKVENLRKLGAKTQKQLPDHLLRQDDDSDQSQEALGN